MPAPGEYDLAIQHARRGEQKIQPVAKSLDLCGDLLFLDGQVFQKGGNRVADVGVVCERAGRLAPGNGARQVFKGVAEQLPFTLFAVFNLLVEPTHELLPPLLAANQLGVVAALREQLVVGTAFHDAALVQHDDLIAIADGGQAVGDDDAGDAALCDGVDDLVLRLRVQGGRRLVHDADGRILGEGAGDFEPLALAAGQVAAAVQQLVRKAALARVDVVENVRVARGQDDLEILDAVVPHLDIVGNGVLKQRDVLINDAHRAGKHVAVDFVQRYAPKGDGAAPGLIQARNQLGQRGFAAAGPADKRDLLAGLDGHGEVGDLRLAQAGIAKGDVFELDGAGELFILGRLRSGREAVVLSVAHHIVHALHLSDHLLKGLTRVDQGGGRSHERAQEALKRHHHADRKLAADDQQYAEPEHGEVCEACDGRGDGAQDQIQARVANGLRVDAGLVSGPAPEIAVFRAAGFDGLDHPYAGHGGRGQLRAVALLHARDVYPLSGDQHGDRHVQEDRADADQRHDPVVANHDDQIEYHHGRVQHQRRERVDQCAGDGRVGGLPVGDVGGEALGEKLHGQAQNLPQICSAANGSQLALNAQRIHRGDPGHRDADEDQHAKAQHERQQPFGIPARQQPVEENAAEHRLDDAQEGADGRSQHDEGRGDAGALQALLGVGKHRFALSGGAEGLRRLKGQADSGELPVKFLPFHGDAPTRGIVQNGTLSLKAAQYDEMVEAPVDDAGEGTLLQQRFRVQTPRLRLHAVAARGEQYVFGA